MSKKFSNALIFLGLNAPGALFATVLVTHNALRTISGDIALFIAPSGVHIGLIALSVAWFVGQAFALLLFATVYTAYSASKKPLTRLSRLIGVQEYKR
mgnify:CR=1 FL=1